VSKWSCRGRQRKEREDEVVDEEGRRRMRMRRRRRRKRKRRPKSVSGTRRGNVDVTWSVVGREEPRGGGRGGGAATGCTGCGDAAGGGVVSALPIDRFSGREQTENNTHLHHKDELPFQHRAGPFGLAGGLSDCITEVRGGRWVVWWEER
jgi:hypothetical protein